MTSAAPVDQPLATLPDLKITQDQEAKDQGTLALHTPVKDQVDHLAATPAHPTHPTLKGLVAHLDSPVKDLDILDRVKITPALDLETTLAPLVSLTVTMVITRVGTIQLFLANLISTTPFCPTFLKPPSAVKLNLFLDTMLMLTPVVKFSTSAPITERMTSYVLMEPSSLKKTSSVYGGTSSPVSLLLAFTN